jgi:molecular chaperone DnaK
MSQDSPLHRVVGIDLGTTYSAVAAYNPEEADAEILPDPAFGPEGAATPSVVWDQPDSGSVTVGRAAKEAIGEDPEHVVIEIKREMGRRANDEPTARSGPAAASGGPEEPVRVWFGASRVCRRRSAPWS